MTLTRQALTSALCLVFLLVGCSGSLRLVGRRYAHSPLIPPLIDIVRSAGPQWAGHANVLAKLQRDGRLFVCERIPGDKHSWATWHPNTISVSEAFLLSDEWSAEDRAEILVIEACHVMTHEGDACHEGVGPRFRAALREVQARLARSDAAQGAESAARGS